MREMKDSGIEWIGKIPKAWNVEKSKYNFSNNKIVPGIHSSEYQRLSLTLNGVLKRNKEDSDGLQPKDFDTYQLLKKGELVFKLIDLQNISTSRVGLAHDTGLVSPAYIVLKSNKNIHPQFAEYFFLMLWHRNIFNALGDAGVRSSLNVSDLLDIPICFPTFQEQKNIADFLDAKCAEIDALTTDIQTQIDTLEQYKRSVITEAVTKGVNPDVEMKDSGIEWIGNIPRHWDIKKIKYVANLSRGIFGHRPRNDPKYYDGEYPFIQTGDVATAGKYICGYSQTLSELGKRVSKEFKAGTIAFTLAANVGDAAILNFDSYFPDSVMAVAPKKEINNIYLYYILSVMKTEFLRVAIVNTQLNLNVERVGNVKIPVTFDKAEQEMIVRFLDAKCEDIDGVIEGKRQQLETLAEYKKSLIYEYVTGKKEVPANA